MASQDFKYGSPQTDGLANRDNQVIDIYHVPSGESVRFKAFVTSFSDAYTSNWNEENAFGRMDPIVTYQNTNRKISLGWDVPAFSFAEAKENMRKASLLLSMLYPEYEDGSGGATTMKSPPLFKIKFLNLIQDSNAPEANTGTAKTAGLLGTIGGFTFEPSLEVGFFQPSVAIPQVGSESSDIGKLFAKTLSFQADFTVLHQHPLGWKNANSGAKRPDSFGAFPYGVKSSAKPPQNIAPGNPSQTINNADGSVNQSATNLANENKDNQSYQNRSNAAQANKLGSLGGK